MPTVFVFDSIHYVLKAEKILKKEGISCELIPVPREISSDCGMALAAGETAQAVEALLSKHSLKFSVHRR